MHLANLLNVPVVAIFGPQRPEWFGPRGHQDLVVFRPEIWCRPCVDYCIFDQPYCLRLISTDEVHGAIKRALHLQQSVSQTNEQELEMVGVTSLMRDIPYSILGLGSATTQDWPWSDERMKLRESNERTDA
jgi:hypothetical protein